MSQQDKQDTAQLALLKKHFANCFDKHGAFIPAKLQEIVQDSGVAVSKEGYSLNWLGKSYARLLANEAIRTRLVADTAHNAKPDHAASQNLLIKGDNLDVLKHLMGAYSEQVKMIYIDPPYNTGSDGFVYQDDRKFTAPQLSELAGIDETEARRILEFTQAKSNSHSAWLTFMYPRLYLARQLLRDDGVIFISIDDNEQAQLKILCDEVFGEENFVESIVWQKTFAPKNDSKYFSSEHEYIFVYAKNINSFALNLLERGEKQNARYANPDNDPRGVWISTDLLRMEHRENSVYSIVSPTGKTWTPLQGTSWRHPENEMLELIKNGEVIFGRDGNAKPRRKRFLKDVKDGIVSQTIWKHEDVGHTQEAKQSLNKLLDGYTVFDTPKPLGLILRCLKVATNQDSVCLDFFAGSGTTAHAVMQLNAEDGGNRRFICVQIAEATDPKSEAHKAGYPTIFDITQARIEKAAAKLKAENPLFAGGLGFKLFETQPMFDKYLDTPDELTENLELFQASSLNAADRQSLLLTWAVRDGIKLGEPLEAVNLGGYTAYAAGKILYFVEPDLTLDAVIAVLEQLDNNPTFAPSRLVVFGWGLDSKIQREMTEAVKGYNNRKGIELTLDIRFN